MSQGAALCNLISMVRLQETAGSGRRNGAHVRTMTNEYSATVECLGIRVRWLMRLCHSQIQLVLNAFSVGCAGFSVLSPYRALFLGLTATSLGMSHMRHRQGPNGHNNIPLPLTVQWCMLLAIWLETYHAPGAGGARGRGRLKS